MGNDGGSIPTRRELVKEAARNPTTSELKETRRERLENAWTYDPISLTELAQPIVSDAQGQLFNKESILEFLLAGNNDGTVADEQTLSLRQHIRSLKDVVEVKFEVEEIDGASASGRRPRWICPVTNKELGPSTKSVYIVPCGHAFAASAIQDVSESEQLCLQCNTSYASNDIIPIIPSSDTEAAQLTLRMMTLEQKGLTHALKKLSGSRKEKKRKREAAEGLDQHANYIQESLEPKTVSSAEQTKNQPLPPSSINNAGTASLTAKVLESQRRKSQRTEQNDNIKSLFSGQRTQDAKQRDISFMQRGFAVSKDD